MSGPIPYPLFKSWIKDYRYLLPLIIFLEPPPGIEPSYHDYKSCASPAMLKGLMEQIIRIELTSSAWQADALTVVLYLQFKNKGVLLHQNTRFVTTYVRHPITTSLDVDFLSVRSRYFSKPTCSCAITTHYVMVFGTGQLFK